MHIRDDKVLVLSQKIPDKTWLYCLCSTRDEDDTWLCLDTGRNVELRHISVFDQIFETEARADVYLAWRGMNFVLSQEK